MKDVFVDVTAEILLSELARVIDPDREVYELLRQKADAACAENGARLRTDRAPEVHVKRAQHYLGWDVLLVASRWAVVAPDSLAAA